MVDTKLIDRCLDLMGCEPGCGTRDEERLLMQRVIDLVREESRTSGPGINPGHGSVRIFNEEKP